MLMSFFNFLKNAGKSKKGQGMVEYGLIISLIAVVVIAGLVILGPTIRDLFISIAGEL